MKQTEINHYEKLLNEVMTEYLASNPNPYDGLAWADYVKERDNAERPIPLTWFDAGAMTALLKHHRDTKGEYEVHPCAIELLCTMFRMANDKLGWLHPNDAWTLSSCLSYDKAMTKEYMKLLHEFVFCITRFPTNPQKANWYVYLLPLLAYQNRDFTKPAYLARFLLHTIDKLGLTSSRGDHKRDLDTDFLRFNEIFVPIMTMCKDLTPNDNDVVRYTMYRDVLSEVSTVFLGCLLQRSAVIEDFGTLAKEIIAYHHIEYQLLVRAYRKQMEI